MEDWMHDRMPEIGEFALYQRTQEMAQKDKPKKEQRKKPKKDKGKKQERAQGGILGRR